MTPKQGPAASNEVSDLRARILDAFARRARERGFRGVVMAELAADLGISTKTLYQEFETKADLVHALVEQLAVRLEAGQAERLAADATPIERVKRAVHTWLAGGGRIHARFWDELRTSHPAAHAVLSDAMRRMDMRGRQWLAAELRPDLSPALAFGFLVALLKSAADPEFCDRAGVTRAAAVDQAIDLWARSALRDSKPSAPVRTRRSTR
jgi:AcrR family transcriptional regulator